MGKSKKSNERVDSKQISGRAEPGYGFLSGSVSRFMEPGYKPAPTPLPDGEGMKRALRRVALPRKIQRLESRVKTLERGSRSRRRRCPLWRLVATVKQGNRSRASDQEWIAKKVDALLDQARPRLELKDACPPSWLRAVSNLPRLLSEARVMPELKKRIAVLISQAR